MEELYLLLDWVSSSALHALQEILSPSVLNPPHNQIHRQGMGKPQQLSGYDARRGALRSLHAYSGMHPCALLPQWTT
jgi:hypothetical protein